MSREFASAGPLGVTFVSDGGGRDFMASTVFVAREPAAVVYGMKVWSGSAWNMKPVKVWSGSAWVEKPVRRWTGSAWAPAPSGGIISESVITTAGASSQVVPAGATSAKIQCFGCGGSGYGGGGSGGAYSRTDALAVTPGDTLYYNLSSVPAGNNPEANPTDTWVRKNTNAAPTTTAQGCLAKSGVQAHPTDFVGRAGGQASACVGDVKFSGGTSGNSDGSTKGGGGGGGAGDANPGGNALDAGSNHTGGYGGVTGGGNGGHGDENGTLLQNGFAPGGGGGGSWVGSDANGALGKIIITYMG